MGQLVCYKIVERRTVGALQRASGIMGEGVHVKKINNRNILASTMIYNKQTCYNISSLKTNISTTCLIFVYIMLHPSSELVIDANLVIR